MLYFHSPFTAFHGLSGAAANALKRSVKLLKQAGPSVPPGDFFERYQRLAFLHLALGRPDRAAAASQKALDARPAAEAAMLRAHRGTALCVCRWYFNFLRGYVL